MAELNPDERAKLLEETDLFATAHAAAASQGQSSVPEGLNTNEHFVAFIQAPDPNKPGASRLIELDGRRPAPLDLGESTNLLLVRGSTLQEKECRLTETTTGCGKGSQRKLSKRLVRVDLFDGQFGPSSARLKKRVSFFIELNTAM
jgi:hypothetical protein